MIFTTTWIKRVRLTPVLLAALCQFAVAAEWPARHFEVIAAEPDMREVVNLDPIEQAKFELDGGVPAGRPADAQLGSWLGEIGNLFHSAGHLAPDLEPIVDVDGVSTYRTYLFPFAGSVLRGDRGPATGATYQGTCGLETFFGFNDVLPWLSVNQKAGANKKRYLGSLSHEMMHALANGDRLLDECHGRAFTVTEGIPNGASMYIYKLKFPGYTGKVSRSRSAVGLRNYALSFTYGDNVEKKNKTQLDVESGYGAGSFWYFVAERFGGLAVYPHFLGRLLRKDAIREDVLKWLDKGLQELPGLKSVVTAAAERSAANPKDPPGMYEVYPAFVTEFASYGGSRYFAYAGRTFRSVKQARHTWLNFGFNGCSLHTITPSSRIAKITLTMSQNSARCFRVKLDGFKGNVTTKLEVIAKRLDLLDQLHLGWAWKDGPKKDENCYEKRESLKSKWPPCIYKTYSQTGPTADRYARTWPLEGMDFGTSGSATAERTYILSNVAVQPWKTKTNFDLVVKVAASDSILKGKPAEPIGPLTPLRKSTKKPIMKLGDIDKEVLYGHQTDPTIPDDSIKGFTLGQYTPNRFQGAKAIKEGAYGVQINGLAYGQTGPIYGQVVQNDSGSGGQAAVVTSLFCENADQKPIGEVLQSDEDAFRVKLETDLCKAGPDTIKQCADGCPVVDHMTAEVNMAFGWRQFNTTAPTDIVTPGVQRYINTMPDSLGEAMRFGAGTALPESGVPTSSDGGPGTGGAGSPDGGTIGVDACLCSCEEQTAFHSRSEELRAGLDAGDDADSAWAEINSQMDCFVECRREYMICTLEEDEAKKEAEKHAVLEKEKKAAESCDCSCESIAKLNARAAILQKQQAEGGSIELGEIMTMSTCFNACKDEVIHCTQSK
jgi:hypothetical protein